MSGKDIKAPTELADEDLDGVEGGGKFDLGLTGTDGTTSGLRRTGLRRGGIRSGKRFDGVRIKKPNSIRN